METSKTPRSSNFTKTGFGDEYTHQIYKYFKEKPENFEKFITEMTDLKTKKKPLLESLKRLCFLLQKSPSLLTKLNDYLPKGYRIYKEEFLIKITVDDTPVYCLIDEQKQENVYDNLSENRISNLLNKVQRRFAGQIDSLQEIKECIERYASSNEYTPEELFSDMKRHLGAEIDLLLEFAEILPNSRNHMENLKRDRDIDIQRLLGKRKRELNESTNEYPSKRVKLSRKENGRTRLLNVVHRIKNSLKNDKMSTEFHKCMYLFINGEISREEVIELIRTMLCNGHKELYEEFLAAMEVRTDGTVRLGNNSLPLPKANGLSRNRVSSSNQCGASYKTLPSNTPLPKCSGRTKLDRKVLNDYYISVSSLSEDSYSENYKKSTLEETMFQCEDERFELDILREQNKSAMELFQKLEVEFKQMSREEKAKVRLDENFGGSSILIRKAYEKIYGKDESNKILNGFKKNPLSSISSILNKLKHRNEDLKELKKNLEKQLSERIERARIKTMEQTTTIFKQSESKRLRARVFINEIFRKRDIAIAEGSNNSHILLSFNSLQSISDAVYLIWHEVKRQYQITTTDKSFCREVLMKFLARFMHEKEGFQEFSIPEKNLEEENEYDSDSSDNEETLFADPPLRFPSLNREESCERYFSLFVGTEIWYILTRLLHALSDRLFEIKKLSDEAEKERREEQNKSESSKSTSKQKSRNTIPSDAFYIHFLELQYSLLSGNVDDTTFENHIRSMFNTSSHIALTVADMVRTSVKYLLQVIRDESSVMTLKFWNNQEGINIVNGRYAERNEKLSLQSRYARNACNMTENGNCYKFFFSTQGKSYSSIKIDLLDVPKRVNFTSLELYNPKFLENRKEREDKPKEERIFLIRNLKKCYLKRREENILCCQSITPKSAKVKELRNKMIFSSVTRCEKFSKLLETFRRKNISENQLMSYKNWIEFQMNIETIDPQWTAPFHRYKKYHFTKFNT
ncbi:DgyrCDS2724 [Dimorphilus gyrociliatus]|uniref:DgyrCDS2724 n=1 Tax=Dimorphilus gyrociliatus TaxID=2664684 RepID=A0A7I8VG94_9ANNE|nr:DgyrCDS2724 [Dimorphilus gyrociliatus]